MNPTLAINTKETLGYSNFTGIIPCWISFKVLKIKYLKDEKSKIYNLLSVPIDRKTESMFYSFL